MFLITKLKSNTNIRIKNENNIGLQIYKINLATS